MESQRGSSLLSTRTRPVKLLVSTGRPNAKVASELGVKEQILGPVGERLHGPEPRMRRLERVELARLRKKNSALKMDRRC